MFSDLFFVLTAFYGVASVAFSCFAFQLLRRRSKKSELWLFQMVYIVVNSGFLAYISYNVFTGTGSLAVYGFAVLFNSCSLLYNKCEYALCAGIELLMPVALYMDKGIMPQHLWFFAGAHVLGAVIAYELGRGNRTAEEYRKKYVEEVKAAEQDPLTKVNNRRGMMRRVISVWPALEEANYPVAVMVIDIDHFKKYNDRFGHPVGDMCLCRVADTVRATVKGISALVSRIGGEEFLVFLYGLEEDEAYALAERIRKNIEGMGLPHAEDAKYRYVTASIGVAVDRCSGEISFGGLYRRADKEVYRAKSAGRNRISCHSGIIRTGAERIRKVR